MDIGLEMQDGYIFSASKDDMEEHSCFQDVTLFPG